MGSPTHETQRHWSSDFVEHLRTVHFSLVILCLGLIIVTGTQRDTAAKRAAAQLDQVTAVAQQLDDGWLGNYCEQRKLQYPALSPAVREGVTPIKMDQHPIIKVRINTKDHLIGIPNQCKLFALLPDNAENRGLDAARIVNDTVLVSVAFNGSQLKPETLKDFVELWNALNQDVEIVVPTSIEDRVRTWSIPAPPSKLDDGNGPMLPYTIEASKEEEGFNLELSPDGLGKIDVEGDAAATANLFVFRGGFDIYIRIPTFGTIPLNGLSYLISLVPAGSRMSWRHGKFDEAFPELSTITKDRQAATFAVWNQALKDEIERGTESFEAFGLKVPAQTTTLWGALLIIGVQLYFLAHLTELSHKLQETDPGWEVAWVGTYRHFLARALLWASALILPVVATIVVGSKGVVIASGGMRTASVRAWITVILGVTASVVIAFSTAKNLPKLKRG